MTTSSTINSQPVISVSEEQLTTNVLLVEWLVKLQQQISGQQRLLSEQQQKSEAQQQEIEQLKEERDKLKNCSSQVTVHSPPRKMSAGKHNGVC